ncbi:hypothetical protein [Nocardioides sp.]|uniref:hypothetical protein n=1 Tax=Nocardioides sp. TaxID=35761 RepID=UPI002726FD1C|nr:hypothetical protein [Nocardioides sp.]MDO9456155.1 hypothetical protein [Nocardioides sp.]
MRLTTKLAVTAAATAVALGTTFVGTAPSSTAAAARVSSFAPAATATITPGVQMYTNGAQCTGNFVFTDSSGGVYVGYAAHCAGLGEATDTNGCLNESVPIGTTVTFNEGGSLVSEGTQLGTGTLVYSSWRTMRANGVTDANTCAYNDFALVKVSAADAGKVNPSIPFWGGPTGIDTDGTAAGDRVWSYGNSSLRAGVTLLSPKTGISLGDTAADGGWTHPLYTVTPGVPGDSGSAFVTAGGKAIGTLSTLGLAPLPLSNNIGDLGKELAYAQASSGIPGLQLTNGTEPFNPIL